MLIGAYTGTTPATLAAYQTWLGRPLDDVLVSINQTSWAAFDSSIGWDVSQWQPTGKSLIWSVPLTVDGTSLAQTATGAYNSHYLAAAKALLASEPAAGPIYVRVGWEFNLSGQPWASQGNEAAFIQSDHNLVDTFRSISDRFKFVWDPNIGGTYDPAKAYPGDAYVDVVGADMYYNPQWDGTDAKAAFATKVSEPYGLQWQQDFAAAHGKPTAISEWGVDTNGSGPYIQAAEQWFVNHDMLYANYWESDAAYTGELHTGHYPDAAAAYQQAFGPASNTTAPPAGIPTLTGSVNTGNLAGTGAVVVDLAGGFVSKGGVTDLHLSHVTAIQTGSDATTVYGLKSGSDQITGGSGTLSVYGQGAADTVLGGTGNATFWAGSGVESFKSGGGTNVMYGGSGSDSMTAGLGTTSHDTFYAKGGHDTVTGGGGTTTLYGGSGTEVLNGGGGTNILFAGSGMNTLNGLMQADSHGLTGTNILYGGSGTDLFYAGAAVNQLHEGSGTDYFASNAGTNTIYGGSGHSYVYGGTGSQTIYTGPGNQYVQAGGGITNFFETAANMKAGRFDQIDGFSGGKSTDVYIPLADKGATSFVAQNGGTAILTAVGGGYAELFVSSATVAAVQAHTHFF